MLNASFPDVDSFRNAITAFATEQGFKAWVAGGAHGAPRCRMICSRSRKSTPGETKCGFSISVRQTAPGDEWVVEELDPEHTHSLGGRDESEQAENSPAPPSRGRKATSEAGSVSRKRRRESSAPKPPPPPPTPIQARKPLPLATKLEPSERDESEEVDLEELERVDENGIHWTPRQYSIRDTEKIARLVRVRPSFPPLFPLLHSYH